MIPPEMNKLALRQIISIGVSVLWQCARGYGDTCRARLLLWRYGAQVGRGLNVNGRLRCFNKGIIQIGRRVTINSGPGRNYVGGDRRMNLWVGRGGRLEIQDGDGVSSSTIVAQTSVIIRDGTLIVGGCDIYDTDFHELLAPERNRHGNNIDLAAVEIGPRVCGEMVEL